MGARLPRSQRFGSGVELEAAVIVGALTVVVLLPERRGFLVQLTTNATRTRLRTHPTLGVEHRSASLTPDETNIYTRQR